MNDTERYRCILDRLAHIESKQEAIGRDTHDIKKFLFGNGQEGLIRESAKNSEFRQNQTKALRRVTAAAITAVISAILGPIILMLLT